MTMKTVQDTGAKRHRGRPATGRITVRRLLEEKRSVLRTESHTVETSNPRENVRQSDSMEQLLRELIAVQSPTMQPLEKVVSIEANTGSKQLSEFELGKLTAYKEIMRFQGDRDELCAACELNIIMLSFQPEL